MGLLRGAGERSGADWCRWVSVRCAQCTRYAARCMGAQCACALDLTSWHVVALAAARGSGPQWQKIARRSLLALQRLEENNVWRLSAEQCVSQRSRESRGAQCAVRGPTAVDSRVPRWPELGRGSQVVGRGRRRPVARLQRPAEGRAPAESRSAEICSSRVADGRGGQQRRGVPADQRRVRVYARVLRLAVLLVAAAAAR